MRQKEVRTTEHNHTPSSKARQPGRHKKQPDTQREGPAKKLGQDATRDQPQGEGKQQPAGEGSRQQPNKGQTQRDPTTHRKAHDGHGKAPANAQAETPTQRKHHQQGATHERKRNTRPRTKDGRESTAQIQTAPNQPTKLNKRGAKRGRNPTEARKKTPTAPQQVGAKRNVVPRDRGHRRQTAKARQQNRGKRRRKGRVATSNSV